MTKAQIDLVRFAAFQEGLDQLAEAHGYIIETVEITDKREDTIVQIAIYAHQLLLSRDDPRMQDRSALLVQPEGQIRNRLAAYAHTAWSGWMRYLFEQSPGDTYGNVVIPASLVRRWKRQTATLYEDLPEEEQASDLVEADRILGIMHGQK